MNFATAFLNRIRNSQVWKSVFRHPLPSSGRDRSRTILNSIFLHIHPPRVPISGIRLKYTWCMGGLTFFFLLVEVITGIFLMFYYRPTVEYAYVDIIDLREQVPFGILRELHRWAAHAMVITVCLHMLRVFMTGSYKTPREFNWVVGVLLLVMTLFLSFTGYLLPWDQLSLWAVTVGTNMARAVPFLGHEGPGSQLLNFGNANLIHSGSDVRFALLGGRIVGENTLLRFYVLHCIAVPFVMMIFVVIHFWRIRKDGGISVPL